MSPRRLARFLVPILAILLPLALAAQAPGIRLGMIAGPQRTTATGVGPIDAEIGGQVGVTAALALGRHLAFRPEALVSVRQLALPREIAPCPIEMLCSQVVERGPRSRLTYLEMPMLMEFRLPTAGAGPVPHAFAGPFLGFRLGCSHRPRPGAGIAADSEAAVCDSPGAFNNGDVGYVLGAGVRLDPVGISLRWTRSLAPMAEHGGPVWHGLAGGQHSSVGIGVDLSVGWR